MIWGGGEFFFGVTVGWLDVGVLGGGLVGGLVMFKWGFGYFVVYRVGFWEFFSVNGCRGEVLFFLGRAFLVSFESYF